MLNIQDAENGDAYVDLSNKKLKKIPDFESNKHTQNIHYLFINNNNITQIRNQLSAFNSLIVLDISFNQLTFISDLPLSLIELDCSNNDIEQIASHAKLERLICSNNKISSLGDFPNLQKIDCNNNKMVIIPTFPKCNKLECNNNPVLQIMPQPLLQQLYCSNTKLCELVGFNNVTTLVCNDTPIHSILKFSNLYRAEIINTLITTFEYFPKLCSVTLRSKVIYFHSKYRLSSVRNQHDVMVLYFIPS